MWCKVKVLTRSGRATLYAKGNGGIRRDAVFKGLAGGRLEGGREQR